MNFRPFKTKDWPVLHAEDGGFRVLDGFRLSPLIGDTPGMTVEWRLALEDDDD